MDQTSTDLPNFLIAGMAKCGTTSLASYISQHPEVYMSTKKEPRFLTSITEHFPENGPKDHLVKEWYVTDFKDYQELFKGRTEKVMGEASADTMYFYQDTIPAIKKYLGAPKVILILRDPYKRAFSAYKHLVRDEREHLGFSEALEAENQRINENWELIYHYTAASFYYRAVKAFKENFERVLVILNEDLQKDPDSTLREVFEFLDVEPDFKIKQKKQLNRSGKPKSQFLHYGLNGKGLLSRLVKPLVLALFPDTDKREALRNNIRNWNLKDIEPPEKIIEEQLRMQFLEDILKTEELIGKDLTAWKAVTRVRVGRS